MGFHTQLTIPLLRCSNGLEQQRGWSSNELAGPTKDDAAEPLGRRVLDVEHVNGGPYRALINSII